MDYRFFHSIVKEVYTDIPNPKMPPQSHLRELRRYAGAFDALELGLEESFCFFNLRNPGEDPVVYLGKTGRKHNAVSEGNFLQCVGWKQTGDVLLERFDEILGTRFHTEAEVDAFAEQGTVPSEEENPVPRRIEPVKVDREAIRAILYGTMLRWQQGTAQVHIAVPKAEMDRYNDYVLGAVKTIWSYFPAYMRAAVGFTTYLSNRRERDFPKFSVVFIPYHMADVNTIRLDGGSPNAYAAMIRSTGMQQLDMVLETLACLDDPEDRRSFLRGLFEDVEKDTDLKTRGFSPMAYVKWGRGLELLNAQTPVSEQIPEWIKFSRTKDSFPAAISRKVDEYIDKHLTPEELNKALQQELRGGRPSLPILDKAVENYLPLCTSRPACKEALWIFVQDCLGQSGQPADKVYQILKEREKSWSALTDPKSYGELLTNCGRQAAQYNKGRTESMIREAGNVALKQDQPNSAQLRDRLTKLRMRFREESAAFVDEISLKEMDTELRAVQRSCVANSLDRELQIEAREEPRGHHAIQAEKKRVADLAALLPSDRSPQEQELFLRIQQRQNELQAMLTDANTISADLQQRLKGINNYFEALDVAAIQAEVLSAADRDRLRLILKEKRPNKRAGYLDAFRMHYGQNLSLQTLKKKKGFFRDCVEEDLAQLFDKPQNLDMRAATTASLLRQIQTMKRESELFGSERGLQIAIGQDLMDADMAERVLGLQPQDVAGQDKQRMGETSMLLLRAGVFRPDQLSGLLKQFEAAECKLDVPFKAMLNGEAGELNQQELLAIMRTALEIQRRKGMDREKALGWISEKMDAVADNSSVEAAFKILVAETRRSGRGNGLWIALVAGLGTLLLAAVVFIVVLSRTAAKDRQELPPMPAENTEEQGDEGIRNAFADAGPSAQGCFALNDAGIDDAKLREVFGYYENSAAVVDGQVPQALLEDPEMLNQLGYRPVLDLSNNPGITDLSGLETLNGLRQLYLDNCNGLQNLDVLNEMQNLEILSLRGLALNEDWIKVFSETHPNCAVLWTQGGQEKLSIAGVTCTKGENVLYLSGHGAALIRALDNDAAAGILAELYELHLDDGAIPTLEGLTRLPALRYLDLSHTELTDDRVAALYDMRSLSVLDLSGNDLSDPAVNTLASVLSPCHIISTQSSTGGGAMISICGTAYPADTRKLDLSGRELTQEDKNALKAFKQLQELDISSTQTENLEFLVGMNNLLVLNLSNNAVEDLSPLWRLAALEKVYAEGNPIGQIGMSKGIPASTLRLLTFSTTSPELDVECLEFAPNLWVLDLGDFRENPETPLAETFQKLGELRVLKLQNLSPESQAVLPQNCMVVRRAPDAASAPAAPTIPENTEPSEPTDAGDSQEQGGAEAEIETGDENQTP